MYIHVNADYCPVLEAPENGAIHEAPESTLVGSEYQFRCNIGCTFNGSNIRYCTENGTWSGDPPQCEIHNTIVNKVHA